MLDAVKAVALLVVVVAHSLGWHGWDWQTGRVTSVLEVRPDIWWITWLQVLPLFFAAGAVANLTSWQRRPFRREFWQRRALRLGTPALVFVTVGTALALPLSLAVPAVVDVGRALPYHLWFLAAYALVVLAVPVTSRWAQRHPLVTLLVWLAVIVLVDVLRWRVAAAIGYLNVVLVWGWVHQLGYSLPRLRALPRPAVVLGAGAALLAAGLLCGLGPYSRSMVSFAGDPELSNMAPPTVVLAAFSLAQVLALAALWPWLSRLLDHSRVWTVVRAVGSRAIGIYLWHLPVLAVLVGVALAAGMVTEPFEPSWWLIHLSVLVLVIVASWPVSGLAGMTDHRAQAWILDRPRQRTPVLASAVLVAVAIQIVGVTGLGTWWGPAIGGLWSSTLLGLALLAVGWWGVGVAGVGVAGVAAPAVSDAGRGSASHSSGMAGDHAHIAGLDPAQTPGRNATLTHHG